MLNEVQNIRVCTKCEKALPATEGYFYFSNKKYSNGFSYWCKNCCREYRRKHQKELTKYNREYKEKYKKKDRFLNNLHQKIRRIKPKQKYCSICNEEKRLELSNISGEYKQDITDYWWLCHACHGLYDRTNKTHKNKIDNKEEKI